jgi:heme-degrading monooxygenase HmoA
MSGVYTTGSWRPYPGQEDDFIEAWGVFASWANGLPGAGVARLARDLRDPERFVSFVEWADLESVRAWKGSPEFKERMGRVQKHIDGFAPTEVEIVATCARGEFLRT